MRNIIKSATKYKPGEFGYIWTEELGEEDIAGKDYKGNINFTDNDMTSLKGAPKTVSGEFNCSYNNLTSLEYAPVKVGKGFYCSDNKLTSLKGAPKEVGDTFYCSNNKLTSLKGSPIKAYSFDCSDNQIVSLEGVPETIKGYFSCKGNKLTNLKGAPEKVGGKFDCSDNKLESLEGAPKTIGGDFNCGRNTKLESLEGIGKVKGKIIPESMTKGMSLDKKVFEYKFYDKKNDKEYSDSVTFTLLNNGKTEIDSKDIEQIWTVDGDMKKAIKEFEDYQKSSKISIIDKKEKIVSSIKKFGIFSRLRIRASSNIVEDIVKLCKTLNKSDNYIGLKLKCNRNGKEGIRYLFIYNIDNNYEVIYDDKETYKDRDLKRALNKWLDRYKDSNFEIIRKVSEYGE